MFLIVVDNFSFRLNYDNSPAETAMENYFLIEIILITYYIVSITIWRKSWIKIEHEFGLSSFCFFWQ